MAADVYVAFRNRLDAAKLSTKLPPGELDSISRMFFDAYLEEVLGVNTNSACDHTDEAVILN